METVSFSAILCGVIHSIIRPAGQVKSRKNKKKQNKEVEPQFTNIVENYNTMVGMVEEGLNGLVNMVQEFEKQMVKDMVGQLEERFDKIDVGDSAKVNRGDEEEARKDLAESYRLSLHQVC